MAGARVYMPGEPEDMAATDIAIPLLGGDETATIGNLTLTVTDVTFLYQY